MAEAIVTARLGDRWEAYSAGTNPAGYVHPRALAALAEIGIIHQGRSKHAGEYRDVPFDLVVTVCDSAAETCPVWLGKGRRVHLGFPDPAEATGTEAEVTAAFRGVRDDIAEQAPALLRKWERENGKIAAASEDGTTISAHFGRAPFYVVTTVAGGKVVGREQREKPAHGRHAGGHDHEGHGHVAPAGPAEIHLDAGGSSSGPAAQDGHASMAAPIADCDVVLARGMGQGAYRSLRSAGIEPVLTDELGIDAAVAGYVAGTLEHQPERLH
jgi:arsenate reductase